MTPIPRTLLFDVNETLLDLSPLDPLFARAFGDAGARREWFDAAVRGVLLGIALGRRHPVAEIAGAALTETAARRRLQLADDVRRELGGLMSSLPPHPDVPPAFQRLRDAGFRLAALSNNAIGTLDAQFARAGLASSLDRWFAAEESGALKPDPAPYRMAADRLGIPPPAILFAAAHGWDIAGAANAGLRTAFVARPGQALDPLSAPPDVVVPDLGALADRLLGAGR